MAEDTELEAPKSKGAVAPLSVARVLQIIETLSAEDGPVSLAKLSRTLDAPKSSLISLLRGLSDMNFVIASNGSFRLGPRSYELGSALVRSIQRMHVSDIIGDGMRELNQTSAETVLYAVLTGENDFTMTYGDIIETRHSVRVAVTIGEQRQLYCTAGGRMLLAERSDEEVMKYLNRASLEKRTENTETNKTRLMAAIRLAREQQVASVSDEMIDGVSGIAAPVRDASGAMRGVLIISGPTARFSSEDGRLTAMTQEAANKISYNLGYRDRGASRVAEPRPTPPRPTARIRRT